MFCSLYSKVDHQARKIALIGLLAERGVEIDASITPNGRKIIESTYCLPGESVAYRLANACVAFSTDSGHAWLLALAISKGLFMFATPLLANAGTSRGLPISCFLNTVDDSLDSLADLYTENIYLSAMGGGIGSHWSGVRSNGTDTSKGSQTTGIIPFMHVQDAQSIAFNQGKTRRGAHAVYLDASHPEIMEFISMRSPEGDLNRKNLHLHHGVCCSDEFMSCVIHDRDWDLIDPHTRVTTEVIKARTIWNAILSSRMSVRGEPYIIFTDNAEVNNPYDDGDYKCTGSNLCTEIFERTDEETTAVGCLSSINLVEFSELGVKDSYSLVKALVEMLDNALTVFIEQAPPSLSRAVKSVIEERSIGLGVMGLHSFRQAHNTVIGNGLISEINESAKRASKELSVERKVPKYATHMSRRNVNLTAIAPNATSSIMLGVSPGIEPWRSNIFTIKQGGLLLEVVNPALLDHLDVLCQETGIYISDYLNDIRQHNGSVQHRNDFSIVDRLKFRTAVEHNQMDLVLDAADRLKYIDQGQSLNLFFSPDTPAKEVNAVHMAAWRTGIKSLYYCRVEIQDRVESVVTSTTACTIDNKDECLACQG